MISFRHCLHVLSRTSYICFTIKRTLVFAPALSCQFLSALPYIYLCYLPFVAIGSYSRSSLNFSSSISSRFAVHISQCCWCTFPIGNSFWVKLLCCSFSHYIDISFFTNFVSTYLQLICKTLLNIIYILYLSTQIVSNWFCGTISPFYLTINNMSRHFILSFALVTVVHTFIVEISLINLYCFPRVQYCCYLFSRIVTDWVPVYCALGLQDTFTAVI